MIIDKKLKNKSGIYQLINKKTKKCYIGSSYDLYRRLKNHISSLNKGGHCNIALQQDYNKETNNFSYEVLEFCPDDKLPYLEQYWLDKANLKFNILNAASRSAKFAGGCIISISISEELIEKVKQEAIIQNRSTSNLIARILEEHYSVLELREKEQGRV